MYQDCFENCILNISQKFYYQFKKSAFVIKYLYINDNL